MRETTLSSISGTGPIHSTSSCLITTPPGQVHCMGFGAILTQVFDAHGRVTFETVRNFGSTTRRKKRHVTNPEDIARQV